MASDAEAELNRKVIEKVLGIGGEVEILDRSGRNRLIDLADIPHHRFYQKSHLRESQGLSEAEGTGVEPATPYGAPVLQTGRSPIRLPSESLGDSFSP